MADGPARASRRVSARVTGRGLRLRRGAGAVGVVVAMLVGPVSAAVATPAAPDPVDRRKAELDRQMAEVREDLEGAKSDFVDAAVALKTAETQLAGARSALAQAQQQLASATARDAELAAELTVAQAEEAKAERELAEQTEQEAETRRSLGQIARQAYVGNQVSGLSIVLQAESADELTDRLAVAGAALRAQNGAIERLAVQQDQMRSRSSKLAAVRAQVTELKRQSAEVVEQRRAAQAAAAQAEADVAALVVTQQQAVTTIQGQIDGERQRLEEMSAEQARLKAILVARAKAAREKAERERAARERAAAEARRRAAQNRGGSSGSSGSSGSGSSSRADGVLSRPVSARISSSFGMRRHPILRISRLHTGTDFAAACGAPVYASADGQIIQAGWAGGYGNRIVVDHGYLGGTGLATTYNHLSRIVRGGGNVKRGQLIGYSGTTGLSTGCHLHFEVLSNGDFVNPQRYL